MPPKNGSPSGRQEDGHRPAAVAGQRDDRVHVDRVEVGPLLAVDLDVDEALVHQRRRLRVLERLVLHHVAPVAGGVADREQDRPVLVACAGERLLAPRVPVDRVVARAGAGTGWSRRRGGSLPHDNRAHVLCAARRRAGGRRHHLVRRAHCTQLLAALGADVVKVEPLSATRRGCGARRSRAASARCSSRPTRASARSRSTSAAAPRCCSGWSTAQTCSSRACAPGSPTSSASAPRRCGRASPELVHCTISSYGRAGPKRSLPGYDPLLQAAGGIISVTGEEGASRRARRRLADRPRDRDVRGARDPRRPARGWRAHARRLALGDGARLRLLPPDRQPGDRRGADPAGNGLPRDRALPGVPGRGRRADGHRRQRRDLRPALRGARPAGARRRPAVRTNPDRVANRAALVESLSARLREETRAVWLERFAAARRPGRARPGRRPRSPPTRRPTRSASSSGSAA